MTEQEYREVQRQLFDIYCGILFNSGEFAPGEHTKINYRFDCPEYKELIAKYHIDEIAGEGTAFQRAERQDFRKAERQDFRKAERQDFRKAERQDFRKAERLMHWMAPKLRHRPDYDNHVPMNSLALLDYSLDKPEKGINCRNKSVILTECCLALGIHARRVYIMPCSPYDMDNHVVTEIFDPEMDKWIMLDPTTDGVFRDEKGVPLSLLELRERFAAHKPAAFSGSEDGDEMNAYFAKNLFRFMVDGDNGYGLADSRILYFTPTGHSVQGNLLASMEYKLSMIPPDAMRLRKLFADMLKKAKRDPEPGTWDISVMEARP